jgi:2-iminoacetate synthase ThiH
VRSGCRRAASCWREDLRRRDTFSRNFTLSLSRTCQCFCKYRAFKTHKAHLYAPDEVEAQLETAVRRNALELLVLTGERPELNHRGRRPGAGRQGRRSVRRARPDGVLAPKTA